MSVLFKVLASTLLLSFFGCCVASAFLQLAAWRHPADPAQGPTVAGVWKPEGRLNEIGIRQMKLARLMLILGGVSFVSFVIVRRVGAVMMGQ
ncbi:hypothetical protein [Longimicrobium terrae]|jgi:hypothetical protein|uniref:Uncharacterized protein n=1 Tax=Longimicrobium terrae TaxID=1639882 RepID=A0A841GL53_9BACT|nr:hypothetical protein [Longimicrobium terrae]MBB4634932.1 hypothetical protein [Longimicrobium terrae]MBB6069327.1 hypothetical protein [Longimicrobium terrae]NNC31865.1 hypothetical protein [Longimicrobium terrae]